MQHVMQLVLTSFLPILLASTVLGSPVSNLHTRRSNETAFSNMYLVTTTSNTCMSNSSNLDDVSAVSLFAPFHTSQPLLRQQSAGYNSLPTFNLTSGGTLTTWADNGFGQGDYLYGNKAPTSNESLALEQGANPDDGGLSLAEGDGDSCLLQIFGCTDDWSVCPGPFGERVITYQGTREGCKSVYVQVVSKPPY